MPEVSILKISRNNAARVVTPYVSRSDVIFRTIKALLPYSFAPLKSAHTPVARPVLKKMRKNIDVR